MQLGSILEQYLGSGKATYALMPESSLQSFYIIFETGSLSEHTASLASRRASGILPDSTLGCQAHVTTCDILHYFWGSKFSPYVCVMTPSLTESLSWSLHAQLPHSQPSQIPHAALDSPLRIRCGDHFLSWQPSRPLSTFSYSHTKVLWLSFGAPGLVEIGLCVWPHTCSAGLRTPSCAQVVDIIQLVSCRMGAAQIPLVSNSHCLGCDL